MRKRRSRLCLILQNNIDYYLSNSLCHKELIRLLMHRYLDENTNKKRNSLVFWQRFFGT
jgi:hypothetical protein